MKKQTAILALLALALSGCSAQGPEPAPAGGGEQTPAATAENPAGEASAAGAENGDPQRPPQGKMVRGQITDILGNEVTLALAEAPQRPEGTEAAARPKATGGDPMAGPPMGGGQQNRAVKLTGETLKLQIPVGVPIVTRTQAGESALELADLVKGDILMVRYDAEGTAIIGVTVSGSGS